MKRKKPETDLCVKKLKVVADEARLKVLEILMEGPKRVAEINSVLGIEQSLLSHHLRVLRDEGFVEATREGKGVRYRLSNRAKAPKEAGINLGCCLITFDEKPETIPR